MKKILFTVIMWMLLTDMLFSQQIPLYSQYYFNPFIYNPSMTGSDDQVNAFLIYRSQWADMPGGPVTTALTLDGPVKEKKIGLGLSLFDDRTGYTERIALYGSFAYRVNLFLNSKLSFGLSFGALENRIDFSEVVVKDQNDPSLFDQYEKKAVIDGNFGVSYLLKNFELGFAIPQIMANSLKYEGNNSRIFYELSRHYLASVKYTFNINKEKNISFYPLILMRSVSGAPLQYDVNAVFNWKNIGWLGVCYKSNYAISCNARIKIANKLSIGYAYDIITSSINSYAGTSHEILLGYTFGDSGKKEYQEKLDSVLAELMEKEEDLEQRYNLIIAQADSLFNAEEYVKAKSAYNKALGIKPNEQYPKDKLAEIDKLLEDKYNNTIAAADKYFNSGAYNLAKEKYQEALMYNPDSEYARDRLTEINNLLEDKYNRAVSAADSLFSAQAFELAKEKYQEALMYNPDAQHPKNRISKIERILKLFEDKYRIAISAADSLYMLPDYIKAKEKYQEALKFKPNALYPKDMIDQIDKKDQAGKIRLTKSSDFLDESGMPAAKGFYIVMGSFLSDDNAERFKKKNGYKSVFNKQRKFHYCYMIRLDTYEKAREILLKEARGKVSDSWLYILK
ncbi:MAG: PorP/SprF family type IX secretion system membrane protein [Bacteroidota bacterium]